MLYLSLMTARVPRCSVSPDILQAGLRLVLRLSTSALVVRLTCLHDLLLVGTQPEVSSSRKPSQSGRVMGALCVLCRAVHSAHLPSRGKALQAGRPCPVQIDMREVVVVGRGGGGGVGSPEPNP